MLPVITARYVFSCFAAIKIVVFVEIFCRKITVQLWGECSVLHISRCSFSAVLRDLDFNLACLILKACCWSFANEKDLTRIYNVRRSSRRFNAISFLIRSGDLLRIVAACVRTVRFFIRFDTVTWQSILVVGFFRAVKLFYFVQS